jgi:hypothetical protein
VGKPLGVAGEARIGGRRVFAQQIAPQGAWPPSTIISRRWQFVGLLREKSFARSLNVLRLYEISKMMRFCAIYEFCFVKLTNFSVHCRFRVPF